MQRLQTSLVTWLPSRLLVFRPPTGSCIACYMTVSLVPSFPICNSFGTNRGTLNACRLNHLVSNMRTLQLPTWSAIAFLKIPPLPDSTWKALKLWIGPKQQKRTMWMIADKQLLSHYMQQCYKGLQEKARQFSWNYGCLKTTISNTM